MVNGIVIVEYFIVGIQMVYYGFYEEYGIDYGYVNDSVI